VSEYESVKLRIKFPSARRAQALILHPEKSKRKAAAGCEIKHEALNEKFEYVKRAFYFSFA
jgi:hypothetical protein